jgi:hypothetical protein
LLENFATKLCGVRPVTTASHQFAAFAELIGLAYPDIELSIALDKEARSVSTHKFTHFLPPMAEYSECNLWVFIA